MNLLFILYTDVNSHNTASLVGLAKSARAKGSRVTVFAMSSGVGNLARKDFTALAADGVVITVCEHNRAENRAPEGIEGVKYGSQYDLAGYIADSDRVVSFT